MPSPLAPCMRAHVPGAHFFKKSLQLVPWRQLPAGEFPPSVPTLGADYMRRARPLSRYLGTSVKHTKNQLCDYMEKFQPG